MIDAINSAAWQSVVMFILAMLVVRLLVDLVDGWREDAKEARQHAARLESIREQHELTMERYRVRYEICADD